MISILCRPDSFEHVVFNTVKAYSENGVLLDSVLVGSPDENWEFKIENSENNMSYIDTEIFLE